VTSAPERTRAQPSRLRLLIPAALIFLYVLQCAWFIRTQSLTYDEPCHIYAGLDAWRHGRFFAWNDHPSLPRLWLTLPLIPRTFDVRFVDMNAQKVQVRSVAPDPVSLARRGRWMNVLLGIALAVALWLAARRFFSDAAANFALALYVFSAAMIAHFSLITTDGIAVLMIFVSALQVVRWRHDPSWTQSLISGVVFGLLLLSKFYAPAFFVICLAVMLTCGPEGFARALRRWHWRKTAVAALIALMLVWAGYFFHVSHLTVTNGHLVATFPNRPPFIKDTRSINNLNLWVPAGEYIDGVREVQFHNKLGHPAFFLGTVTSRRLRAYYPVAVALKWPPVLLVVSVVALVTLILRRRSLARNHRLDFWILAIFPVLSFVLALNARIHIGDRHVLPMYPFLLLLAAAAWERATRSPQKKIWFALLVVAAALNAFDCLRYAPGYLSYFTPFVRPGESYKLLTDSNLDWGQGLIALRDYQQRNSDAPISLAYFGTMQPELYGIKYTPFDEGDRPRGTVVISATLLSGQYSIDHDAFRWLEKYPRVAVLDGSLFVYEVK
jgi:4-amino-4-deoxy-L-arabinose transferase-like glycosyltransferase